MRELKFRAWDNGQMEYSKKMPDFSFWKWAGYSTDTVLMQFTGLKDKNGKEIYEGDILKKNDEIKIMNWQEGYTEPFCFSYFEASEDWEIIGNKWENPELAVI